MKKILALVLALALVACASLALADEVKVMTKEEFDAAAADDPVCVEAYVQAAQGWWESDGVGQMTLYLQNEEGGFFAYNVQMTKEESEKLIPGTKIRINGYKMIWGGEVEFSDAKYEILEAEPFIAEPKDVTSILGTDELINHMNEKIVIKGAEIVPYIPTDEGVDLHGEFPFVYSSDGSGTHDGNNDLYFTIKVNDQTYTMTVESYLCGNETDVYKAVEALKIGDTIDCEGFLYWYNGANPHITSVTVTEPAAE